MNSFSIKLAKRTATGYPIPGQYVEFETDDAAELAEFFDKNYFLPKGKRDEQVNNTNTKKKKKIRRDNKDALQLQDGVEGE